MYKSARVLCHYALMRYFLRVQAYCEADRQNVTVANSSWLNDHSEVKFFEPIKTPLIMFDTVLQVCLQVYI